MDDEGNHTGDVFAIPDLWAPSKWLIEVQQKSGLVFSELKLDGNSFHLSAMTVLTLNRY